MTPAPRPVRIANCSGFYGDRLSAAREMVGQPHLADHGLIRSLAKVDGGPVHIIACHKGVTEAQAQRMLGFPNATVVERGTRRGAGRALSGRPISRTRE